MPGNRDSADLIVIIFFRKVAESVLTPAKGQLFVALSVGVEECAAVLSEVEADARDAHRIRGELPGSAADLCFDGRGLFAAGGREFEGGSVLQEGSVVACLAVLLRCFAGVLFVCAADTRTGRVFLIHVIDNDIEEGLDEDAHVDGVALVVAGGDKDEVFVGDAEHELAAHAPEEPGIAVGPPDLVAVAVQVPVLGADGVGVDLLCGGGADVRGVEELLALEDTAVCEEAADFGQVAGGAQQAGIGPGVAAGAGEDAGFR